MIFHTKALELGNEEKRSVNIFSLLPVIANGADAAVNRSILEWSEAIHCDGARNISQPQSPLFF